METVEIYSAYNILDDRGHRELIGHFIHKVDAELAAKGKGWYAGDGDVEGPIKAFGNYQEFLEHQKQENIRSAMAKLTAAEIRALGLNPDDYYHK